MCLIIYFKVDKIGFKNMYSNILGTVGCKKNGNCQNKIEKFVQFFHSVKTMYLNFHFRFFSQPTVYGPVLSNSRSTKIWFI
jgi:hypothetical protein